MPASTSSVPTLPLGPDTSLSSEALERAALHPNTTIASSDAARTALRRARTALGTVRDDGAPVYGVTTGFGPLHEYEADDAPDAHGDGLLAHLATGSGDWVAPPLVRALTAARLHSLAQGHSAIRPSTFDGLVAIFEANVVPAVPAIGSVGASGDLTPLAHVARACTGEGLVLDDGTPAPAAPALSGAGVAPVDLDARDALALVNGTDFMTAAAALAVARTQRLLERAEVLTGWAYRLLGCSLEPLDARLHEARGHTGQVDSAAAIREEATRDGRHGRDERPLQEVYSLRCAPQILGAVRDQLDYTRQVVETELNGVTDNPVIDPDEPAALHGGNFQGQQVAFAADALNEATTQIGVLAERQIDLLLSPEQTDGAPPLLAWDPGPTSGLAGAQLTATALVAELRQNAQMAGTSSIPTNGDNQDIVSMGALAARTAHEQTEHLAPLLAVLGLALAQLTHLREEGRADGPAPSPPDWMPAVDPIKEDRPLRREIDHIATEWTTPPDLPPAPDA
ncbi:MAG: aromatic amino acid lyase [Bacteroidetes bacterium SW_9_63_38]|nr:MAG: aromatic amino acid lyase [Bacteroidetes bacterium SW_9_63_38]